MDELTQLILALSVVMNALTRLIAVLKDGKFNLHIRIGKKMDVLSIDTEHHTKNR